MIILELPIYYTFTKKTKKDNKVLVGMNWYRNAHFRNSNQVKQHYHSLIYSKVTQSQKLKDKYMVSYMLYPSNSKCDLMNVVSVIDKFLNDALQDCGVVLNDNIKFYKHSFRTVSFQKVVKLEGTTIKKRSGFRTVSFQKVVKRY